MNKGKMMVIIEKKCKFCKYLLCDYEACCQPCFICEKHDKGIFLNCVCNEFELDKDYKFIKEV